MKTWILAIRPKTLSAAVVPIMVATSLARFEGYSVQWHLSVLALLGALFIQMATNLFNDAIDFKKGADTEDRIGPQRVTQSGQMSYKTTFFGALLFCLLATLCGVPLVIQGGWPLVFIGLISLLMAYSYTGGPFPLAYLGLGDLFVVLFFGLIAVGGVYFLQTQTLDFSTGIAGLQVGFLSTALIAINNTRDRDQDKKANKKTLAVRFGLKFSRFEVLSLYVFSFALGIYWWYRGSSGAFFLPLMVLPLVIKMVHTLFTTKPSAHYNSLLAQSALIQILFCTFLTIGLWTYGSI